MSHVGFICFDTSFAPAIRSFSFISMLNWRIFDKPIVAQKPLENLYIAGVTIYYNVNIMANDLN